MRIRGFDQDIVQIWNEDMPKELEDFTILSCFVGLEMVLMQLYQH